MNYAPAAPELTDDFAPLRPDYRTQPISQSFDWPSIFETIGIRHDLEFTAVPQKYYAVEFHSKRRQLANPIAQSVLNQIVTRLDAAAHAEALAAEDAVLHYEGGELSEYVVPDEPTEEVEPGLAVSWCMWRSQRAARLALNGPIHKLSVGMSDLFYEEFTVILSDVFVSRPSFTSPLAVTFQELQHPHRPPA